jgi:hypothetical protein
MKSWKIKTHFLAKEALQYTLLTYLILVLAETFKEGFVSYFFNIHILLGFIAVLGAIVVVTYHEEKSFATHKINFLDVLFSIIVAAAGAILVYDRTINLGLIAFAIVGISGIMILFFSLLLFSESSK